MNKKTLLVVETKEDSNVKDFIVKAQDGSEVELIETIDYPFEGDFSTYLLYLLERVTGVAHVREDELNHPIPSFEELERIVLAVAAEREEMPVSLERAITSKLIDQKNIASH